MTHSMMTLLKVADALAEAHHALDRCAGWSEDEMRDEQLGQDLDELRRLLDGARGRVNTVLERLGRNHARSGKADDGPIARCSDCAHRDIAHFCEPCATCLGGDGPGFFKAR